jgi:hypothetical protein
MVDECLSQIETSENPEMVISPLEWPSDPDTIGKGIRTVASILMQYGT